MAELNVETRSARLPELTACVDVDAIGRVGTVTTTLVCFTKRRTMKESSGRKRLEPTVSRRRLGTGKFTRDKV